jgi:hypothetical protein
MDKEITDLIERGVSALERLAQDPVIEMQTGPPVCPHCDEMNPLVEVSESNARGKLGEVVFKFTCMHCSTIIYGIPLQWQMTETMYEVERLIAERAELAGYVNNS